MVLREVNDTSGVDSVLLGRFRSEIKSRVPHLATAPGRSTIVNETPLVDMTSDVVECARVVYGLEVPKDFKVFGKLESSILGGSIKVRPAVQIIEDAITSGKLTRCTTVFEATSGNFGIALGFLKGLGLEVVALVSRRLQDGVLRELKNAGVRTLNLEIDICPAPGTSIDADAVAAKAVATSIQGQLVKYGFGPSAFESSRPLIEDLLARRDAIALAKHFARIYGGFCPEQYDNELNARAHEFLTGPEIDQQLLALGGSLAESEVVCTFGTGGTSAGLSRYVQKRYGKKSVHVVFPLVGQDVAGIRDKEKALGLKFYKPVKYAGLHEVDFDRAKQGLAFFARKGYDIGESSILALYATMLQANRGRGNRFVVILADGIQKYRELDGEPNGGRSLEVTLKEAMASPTEFGGVLWTHPVFVPSATGIALLASSLGCEGRRVGVVGTHDVGLFYTSQEMTEGFRGLLPKDGKKLLLVCMNGSTSLRLAESLSSRGIAAVSLSGGMASLPLVRGKEASELVKVETA